MSLLPYIGQITPEMTAKVNELKATDFEGATSEDIEIYAQWSALVKMQEDEFTQRRKQLNELHAAQLASVEENARTSTEALEALKDAALAKLEAVKNGQA